MNSIRIQQLYLKQKQNHLPCKTFQGDENVNISLSTLLLDMTDCVAGIAYLAALAM